VCSSFSTFGAGSWGDVLGSETPPIFNDLSSLDETSDYKRPSDYVDCIQSEPAHTNFMYGGSATRITSNRPGMKGREDEGQRR
jgi:hypothetical protein